MIGSDDYYKQLKKELHSFMEHNSAVHNTRHPKHDECMRLINEAQAQIREWSESRTFPDAKRSIKKKKEEIIEE